MNRKKIALTATAAAALVLAAGGAAIAGSGDDDASDTAIQGPALQQASEAALAETGGGKVTETEVDDEESYYEVEVTLANGDQVDVQLDEAFHVVGSKTESGGESESD
ncbi:PepSY domain-containing protein [Nocardioides sp.]|uniref:PepSY domain-containing protein n=1 Tax=Nocardioides sp. TaxID=35761 RepID=UPI00286E45E0|nr:PepSY domain-containing protein [Nocardioides sp.]